MIRKAYANWMYRWETALTTRDENRIVRPLEWGFDWLDDYIDRRNLRARLFGPSEDPPKDDQAANQAMLRLGDDIIQNGKTFFGYRVPTDFRLEERHPQLFPTNVRPETLQKDAELRERAESGEAVQGGVSAIYLAGENDSSGERPGECAVVSGACGKASWQTEAGHHRDAAVECGRLQSQCSLLAL